MFTSVGYRGLLIVALPLAFELLLVFVLSSLLASTEKEIARQRQARETIDHCSALSYQLTQATTLSVLALNFQLPSVIQRKKAAMRAVKDELTILRDLSGTDKEQLKRLHELSLACHRCAEQLSSIKFEKNSDEITSYLGDPKQFELAEKMVVAMGAPMNAFLKGARSTEEESPEKQSRLKMQLVGWLAFGVVVNIAMAVLMTVFTIRSITRPLLVLSDNTRRLTSKQALNPPLSENDEIADIDRSFHEMYEHLQAADLKRKQLSELAAERLRAPLERAQSGISRLQAAGPEEIPEAVADRLKMAETGLHRITALLFDLSNNEQMDRGALIMKFQDVSIKELIDRCVISLNAYMAQKKIQLKVTADDIQVRIDPDRIEQVLINLLSNAIKFSKDGDEVSIICKKLGEFAELSVIDRGPGVPPERREQIFEAYKQLSKEDATVRGGFGLGLSICKNIIEQHSGVISVDSSGSGSRFWFRLPLQAVSCERSEE